MALEQITRAVLEAARTQADHILKSAKKNADERLAAGRKAAEQEAERRYQSQTRAIQEEQARKLIQLQGASNKELLNCKNALLHQVFAQARERILALPSDEYASVLRNLLDKTVAESGGKLRIHPDDREIFDRLAAEFNQGRSDALKVGIDEEQRLPERGGFIFIGDVYQVDQTLGTLLENIRYELGPSISAELFSGRKEREVS